jgi:hypothetical protein
MKVKVLTAFKHDGDYHEGEVRVVSDSLGVYFCQCGWVEDEEGIVPTEPVEKGKSTDFIFNGLTVETSHGE